MLIDESQLINCSMGYHNGLSGLICRALNQPPSYKENMANRICDTVSHCFPLFLPDYVSNMDH